MEKRFIRTLTPKWGVSISMVRILRTTRDEIRAIDSSTDIIDLDGYISNFLRARQIFELDPEGLIHNLIDALLEGRSTMIFSFDTMINAFIEVYGRRRYKYYMNSFLLLLQELERCKSCSITFIRFGPKLRNDPSDSSCSQRDQ